MAFNLLQLFLPDLWTPLTYPSDIYPWRAGTVPLAFPSSFLMELSQVSLDTHDRVQGRLWGQPMPQGQEEEEEKEENEAVLPTWALQGSWRAWFPWPWQGLGTIRFRGKVDELFELNLVQMPMLGRNTVLEAKEGARRDGRAISASLICISECSALGWIWFNPGEPVLSPSLTSRCYWRAGQGQEHGWEGGGDSSRSREQSCPCSAHTLPQPAIEPSPGPQCGWG